MEKSAFYPFLKIGVTFISHEINCLEVYSLWHSVPYLVQNVVQPSPLTCTQTFLSPRKQTPNHPPAPDNHRLPSVPGGLSGHVVYTGSITRPPPSLSLYPHPRRPTGTGEEGERSRATSSSYSVFVGTGKRCPSWRLFPLLDSFYNSKTFYCHLLEI